MSRGARALWLAAAALVALPSVAVGFYGEDLYALAVLEGRVADADWTEVYAEADAAGRLGDVQGDHFPWWTTDVPQPRRLRPVAAASLAIDHALFGRDARAFHVVGLLLFVLVVWLAGASFEALGGGERRAVYLATLLFVLDEVHTVAICEASARHALIGAALGLLAWLLHRAGHRWIALVPLGLALAASETAAPVATWFLAGALTLEGGPLRARVERALPAIALGVGSAAVAWAAGLGPLRGILASPGESLVEATRRLPILAGALVAPIRPERLNEASGGAWVAVGGAIAVAVISALALPVLRARRSARFAGLALLLHLPWLALDAPSSVGLLLPSVLSAWLLALVIAHHARRPQGVLAAALLLGVHAVLAPALHLRRASLIAAQVRRAERAAASVPRDPDARVLLLTSPAGVDTDLPLRLRLGPRAPAGVWLVSLSLESHGLWHPDPDGIELTGELLIRARERRWRSAPLAVGERYRRGALAVRVVPAGPHIARVRLELDVPPEDVWLLARHEGGYRAVALPEEGGAVTLPRARQ